jgi:hypothetical protein
VKKTEMHLAEVSSSVSPRRSVHTPDIARAENQHKFVSCARVGISNCTAPRDGRAEQGTGTYIKDSVVG